MSGSDREISADQRDAKPVSIGDRIQALRVKGWSDRSIARHLGVPIEDVRRFLGIKFYRNGEEVPA